MVPWLAGIVPFGLVIGVSVARADVPALTGWLTGPLIYAGSAQVATIGMLDAGAAPVIVVASALIINVRILFYSATMPRYWRGTPWWWRLVGAYLARRHRHRRDGRRGLASGASPGVRDASLPRRRGGP
jgi:predicted branched-subunit amino acid permease